MTRFKQEICTRCDWNGCCREWRMSLPTPVSAISGLWIVDAAAQATAPIRRCKKICACLGAFRVPTRAEGGDPRILRRRDKSMRSRPGRDADTARRWATVIFMQRVAILSPCLALARCIARTNAPRCSCAAIMAVAPCRRRYVEREANGSLGTLFDEFLRTHDLFLMRSLCNNRLWLQSWSYLIREEGKIRIEERSSVPMKNYYNDQFNVTLLRYILTLNIAL